MSLHVLQCPTCNSRYQDPHMLPGCGHTFCRSCIEAMRPRLQQKLVGPSISSLQCPICYQSFPANSHRPNLALWQLLNESSVCKTLRGEHDDEKIAALRSMNVPPALAQVLLEEDRQIGLKIFILDNSGSTSAHDGHIFYEPEELLTSLNLPANSLNLSSQPGQMFRCDCSRWEEIKWLAKEQAKWALAMGTPCEFRLLNPGPLPLREGFDFIRMDGFSEPNPHLKLSHLNAMLDRISPHGYTPIAERLNEVYTRIKQDHAELARHGQRVVVVLATDGCPTEKGSFGKSTDKDKRGLIQCIKRLISELPVFMVIRLTSDEDDVINFYNQVDQEIELSLEVLDDMESEAKEVHSSGNGWLTYSPLIHKIREGGTLLKLFDLLDERPLTPVEIILCSQLLLRPEDESGCSCPGKAMTRGSLSDSERFVEALREYSMDAPLVYHPLKKIMTKPIEIEQVTWKVLPTLTLAKQALDGVVGLIVPLWPATTQHTRHNQTTTMDSNNLGDTSIPQNQSEFDDQQTLENQTSGLQEGTDQRNERTFNVLHYMRVGTMKCPPSSVRDVKFLNKSTLEL